uniref:Membrane-anchored junction protein isoform X1 n=1 Tax=Tursiops truncatus TaxID=9739 RepID=A0A2U4CB57_TURTR|nr:membrane-anchored junction protein isoform X1 [Tursiops truncatus]
MSLKPFTYPFPETRFLHAGSNVYKFKIRYGNNIRGEEVENKEVIVQELEDSIRVVLGNLDNLQPFATEHFIVFPCILYWVEMNYSSHCIFKWKQQTHRQFGRKTNKQQSSWVGPRREEGSRSHDEETKTRRSAQLPSQARAGQAQEGDFQPRAQQKEGPYGNQEGKHQNGDFETRSYFCSITSQDSCYQHILILSTG